MPDDTLVLPQRETCQGRRYCKARRIRDGVEICDVCWQSYVEGMTWRESEDGEEVSFE